MEQYNNEDSSTTAPRVKDLGQDIGSLASKMRRLEELLATQQSELIRLNRELGRIKNDVTDLAGLMRRG